MVTKFLDIMNWIPALARLVTAGTAKSLRALIMVASLGLVASADSFPQIQFHLLSKNALTISLDPSSSNLTNFVVEQTPTLDGLRFWTTFDTGTVINTNSIGFFRVRLSDDVLAAQDSDGDGIDDLYEFRHPQFLNPEDPTDAGKDWDRDGRSNLEEYRDGTDPDDQGGLMVHSRYWNDGITYMVHEYMAIDRDGRLWSWTSQNSDDPSISVPNEIMPGKGWKYTASSIESMQSPYWAGGIHHYLAVAGDGTLWAWGANDTGQLGVGSSDWTNTPIRVGAGSDWAQVVAGRIQHVWSPTLPGFLLPAGFSVALKTDGSLWQWGVMTAADLDTNGLPLWKAPHRVGGTDTNGLSDSDVPHRKSTSNEWASIRLFHGDSVVGLKRDGSLWIWGLSANQAFGSGASTTVQIPNPRRFGGDEKWARVEVDPFSDGAGTVLAIKRDGTLWTWNHYTSPSGSANLDLTQSPVNLGAGWRWSAAEPTPQFGSTGFGTTAVREDGTLWFWGQLQGYTHDQVVDQPVLVDSSTKWTSLHGNIGRNTNGDLRMVGGNFTPILTQPWRIGTNLDWVQVSAGLNNSVGVRRNGSLWHWGRVVLWPSGGFDGSMRQVPTEDLWSQVSLSRSYTFSENMFGVGSGGTAMLWGYTLLYWGGGWVPTGDPNSGGPYPGHILVPTQSPYPSYSPRIYDTNGTWKMILRGADHGAGIKSNGTLWAWGLFPKPVTIQNSPDGILSIFSDFSRESRQAGNTPTQISSRNDWTTLSAGAYHDLALTADGSLFALGYNESGQIGNGGTENQVAPVQIGQPNKWASVAAGDRHSLAIQVDGSLWAWGANDSGQLGDPALGTNSLTPKRIGLATNWKVVYAGPTSSYALDRDGRMWAWGANNFGQLGLGDTASRTVPAPLARGLKWSSVSAGASHTLAIGTDGSLWGWGYAYQGALPDPDVPPPALSPVSSRSGW